MKTPEQYELEYLFVRLKEKNHYILIEKQNGS